MFPLQQGSELVFQISADPQENNKITQQDLVQPSLLGDNMSNNIINNNNNNNKGKSPQSRKTNFDYAQYNFENNSEQKMMRHREVERQRRQEMSNLHASLRSLLPLHLIKGKRSMSDHMNVAVNYIKHLQNKMKQLGAKRDELKQLQHCNVSPTPSNVNNYCKNSCQYSDNILRVQPCFNGVEIVISSCGVGESTSTGFSLSMALHILVEQGLDIVSCVSTKVNNRLLHTIQSQVSNMDSINLLELEQKLTQVISSFS